MNLFDLILISVSLAMDAFAVSVTNSMGNRGNKKLLVASAFIFGLFQMLMPLIGFFVGNLFTDYVNKYTGLIGFILLSAMGAKSIYSALKPNDDDAKRSLAISPSIIVLQAIATSIDALAVGISFAMLEVNIFSASIIIGLITVVICFIGLIIGKNFNKLLGNKAELAGGIVLMIIAFKILFS